MRVAVAYGVIFAVALAVPALAASERTGDSARTQRDPDRVVCRRAETTGSILGGRRVCKTVAEWDAIARNLRETLDSAGRERAGGRGQ